MFKRNIDVDYVNKMIQRNDGFWSDREKWFYYDYKNQNYIIPTILLNIVIFFTNPPVVNILECITFTCLMLFFCHLNNIKMDNNPYFIKRREEMKEFRKKNNMI